MSGSGLIGFAQGRLVATTDRIFTMVTTARIHTAASIRTRLVPVVAPLLFRLPGMRALLFRTVSQIGIQYRKSPLSEGAAASVRGGDRLPWVETGPHEDNFAPLKSLTWQVHVYGEPQRGVAEACAKLGVPLYPFAWQPEMRRSGLVRGALYLVRPDGYVALADPDGEPERLGRYFLSRGLAPTRRRDEGDGLVCAPG